MDVWGVLFDLDGTLHDRAATLRDFLTGHAARFDLPPGYAERFTGLADLLSIIGQPKAAHPNPGASGFEEG